MLAYCSLLFDVRHRRQLLHSGCSSCFSSAGVGGLVGGQKDEPCDPHQVHPRFRVLHRTGEWDGLGLAAVGSPAWGSAGLLKGRVEEANKVGVSTKSAASWHGRDGLTSRMDRPRLGLV